MRTGRMPLPSVLLLSLACFAGCDAGGGSTPLLGGRRTRPTIQLPTEEKLMEIP